MRKLIVATGIMFLLYNNLYAYTYNHEYVGDPLGMCGEHAEFQVAKSEFPAYWQTQIVEISKNAANLWNEAGSEHHLYYDGEGTTNPEIEWGDWCDDAAAACTTWWPEFFCISTSGITITVDDNYWNENDNKVSYLLQNTIAHEFGHLMGLDHTQDHRYL